MSCARTAVIRIGRYWALVFKQVVLFRDQGDKWRGTFYVVKVSRQRPRGYRGLRGSFERMHYGIVVGWRLVHC